MVCNVIDECRCYQLRGNPNQFCAVRRGERVLRCPEDCCAGGGGSDGPRQPCWYIDVPGKDGTERPKKMEHGQGFNNTFHAGICLCVVLILDLKIRGLRKV